MSITLTDRAASHVSKFLEKYGQEAGLRLAVKPTGCSGYSYVVEPAEQIQEQDQVFESRGISIVVDAQSLEYLDGTEVDYGRDGLNEGFRFNNPKVQTTCGCGESFTI